VRNDGVVLATRRLGMTSLRKVTIGDRSFVWRLGPRPDEKLLVDAASGETMVTIRGSHGYKRADTTIELPGGRQLTFPVSGTAKRGLLRGVDASGHTILTVRRPKSYGTAYEIVISPEENLSDPLLCVLAVVPPLLPTYFNTNYN